ncbi:hypothetical protein ACS5PN_05790 [Roseateles sp. NT4]|uniref:hypothetical protein n=1 Tax=Roseateles sp. NT4 TaxID=3453715 RepID=UPI003EEA75FA
MRRILVDTWAVAETRGCHVGFALDRSDVTEAVIANGEMVKESPGGQEAVSDGRQMLLTFLPGGAGY